MRLLPFILFIAIPLIELAILIKIGEVIGIGATILLVIATAVIGVSLLKRQGLAAFANARAAMDAGEFPVDSVVDGVCLLIAGAFLLTPGLLTDTVGFTLLVPQFRRSVSRWLFDKVMASGNVHVDTFGTGPNAPPRQDGAASGPTVIDGEFEDIGETGPEKPAPDDRSSDPKSSPWRK